MKRIRTIIPREPEREFAERLLEVASAAPQRSFIRSQRSHISI